MSDDFEYQSMLQMYKGGYFDTTTEIFEARFDSPTQVYEVQGADVIAGPMSGGLFLYATIGFGVNPPGLEYPPFELVAIASALDDDIAKTLLEIGFGGREDEDPLRPYHKFRFAEDEGGFFLLDGGVFGSGWDVQRLLVVPVTGDEYRDLVPRDEVPENEEPQALQILRLDPEAGPLSSLPASVASRWAL